MRFQKRYPVPLQELLLAPIVFRDDLPGPPSVPEVSAKAMADIASFGGYKDGAIRTALSRLRTSGTVEMRVDREGVTRYRLARLGRSIGEAVRGRPARPDGLLLAIFSFSASDGRERKIVRDALRLHGFHKLAQNVYVNGHIDTGGLEALFEREGIAEHVYWFRAGADDPRLAARLTGLFDLDARARQLARLQGDLERYLGEPKLPPLEAARRLLYAGPVHYRVSYVEEPPLPAALLPAGYPLDALEAQMAGFVRRHARALQSWFSTVSQ